MSTPSEAIKYAMKPSRWVLFWRTFFPYQLYRFIWINLRMLRMIFKSHHQRSVSRTIHRRGSP
jgi:hypothetical protein